LRYAIVNAKNFHSDVYNYTGDSFCAKSVMTFTPATNGYLYAGVPEGASNAGDNQGGYMIKLFTK
jgi:hypothetical protein